MGELPYMAVCLAEVCNNVGWKPTHRHRQTHTHTHTHIQNPARTNDANRRYQRPDQPIKNLWAFCSEITEASSEIKTNCPRCLCLFVKFSVCLGTCKTRRQREKVCESVCACHCADANKHTHAFIIHECVWMLAKNISFKQRPFLSVWVSVCVHFKNTYSLNSCHTLPTYAMSLACVPRSTATWLRAQTAPNNQTIQTLNCTQALESFEMWYE